MRYCKRYRTTILTAAKCLDYFTFPDDTTLVQHYDPARNPTDQRHIVVDKQDCLPRRRQRQDDIAERMFLVVVQPRAGLVEHQHLRAGGKDPRDAQQPALAGGQHGSRLVRQIEKANGRKMDVSLAPELAVLEQHASTPQQ